VHCGKRWTRQKHSANRQLPTRFSYPPGNGGIGTRSRGPYQRAESVGVEACGHRLDLEPGTRAKRVKVGRVEKGLSRRRAAPHPAPRTTSGDPGRHSRKMLRRLVELRKRVVFVAVAGNVYLGTIRRCCPEAGKGLPCRRQLRRLNRLPRCEGRWSCPPSRPCAWGRPRWSSRFRPRL